MYKIKNNRYFNSLVSYRQKMVMDLLEEFNRKGIKIVDNRNFGRSYTKLVDVPEMIKEGNMLKRFISKEDNEFMVLRIFAKCFGVSIYYFNIRVRLTGLIHNAIHAYYAHAIKFYDIQMLVRMSKDEQQNVLTKLLEVGNSSDRLKRAEFYRDVKKNVTVKVTANRTKVLIDNLTVKKKNVVKTVNEITTPSLPSPPTLPSPVTLKKEDRVFSTEDEDVPDNIISDNLLATPIMVKKDDKVEIKEIEDISRKIQRNTEMEIIVPEGNVMGHNPMSAIVETGKKRAGTSVTDIESWKMVNGY